MKLSTFLFILINCYELWASTDDIVLQRIKSIKENERLQGASYLGNHNPLSLALETTVRLEISSFNPQLGRQDVFGLVVTHYPYTRIKVLCDYEEDEDGYDEIYTIEENVTDYQVAYNLRAGFLKSLAG